MHADNGKMTRRTLLTRSARAAAIAATVSPYAALMASPRSRGFKIGACDWSLGKQSDPAAFDVAKQIGLDGVQISLGTVQNDMHLRRPEVQKSYADAARRTGLEIASLAIGEMNQVPLKSDPRAARWLADSIDVCKSLGLTVSMAACFYNGDLDLSRTAEIDHLVGVLKDITPKAEKQGITIGLESYLSAEDNMRLLERVGSPAVMVYYDVGNSTDKGRNVYREIRLLGKLICELHAKDNGYMLGQGRIDFPKVRQALDDIQYRGWIQIEAATPHGLIPDYTADRKFLKKLFPRTV
jgi:sugar phosphate isomerase/epimerase